MPDCISAMKKFSASSGQTPLEVSPLRANPFDGRVKMALHRRNWRWRINAPRSGWFAPAAGYCGTDAGGCGVSTKGGLGLGGAGRAAPGAGRISIAGGSGATCWLTTGGAGLAGGGGRGATTFGFGDGGTAGTPAEGSAGAAGGIDAGIAGGASPRSIESNRFVSRSIARTASHDESAETSTVRSSLSGEPAAKIWISGWPLRGASSAKAMTARMSA